MVGRFQQEVVFVDSSRAVCLSQQLTHVRWVAPRHTKTPGPETSSDPGVLVMFVKGRRHLTEKHHRLTY